MTPRISVIIPTIGRGSLLAALDSCSAADEIVVVVDGDHVQTNDPILDELSTRGCKVGVSWDNAYGYAARTLGITMATGTHIGWLDDDDIFLPGAIEMFRAGACEVPAIFQMDHPRHGILWRNQKLEFGNVGTPMMLIPNKPDLMGKWEPFAPHLPEPGGDFMFLKGCVEKMGGPVWWAEVVAKVRPHDRTSVSVVTPWLNRHDLAADYKVAIGCGMPDELIVVDNGSDPAIGMPGVRLDYNAGFCGASNIGLHEATSDAVLFLNNDIVATRADWLWQIKEAVEPGVLVGPIRYTDLDGQPFPYIDGWCLAGMRDDLLELGGFDGSLEEPAYFSDVLLSLEARAAGMTLRDLRPGLTHLENQTAGPASKPDVVAASAANRRVFENRARHLLTATVAA